MSRVLNKLTARQVATLKTAGRHADGGGLYLRITNGGARSWVFMSTKAGKRLEVGLGAALAVSLATARGLAGEMRELLVTGGDPRTVRRPAKEVGITVPTFDTFAESYIASVESGWRNAVHRQQWRNSLRDHAKQLNDLRVDEITTEHVLEVLRPIWPTKAETAKRVRGRIEKILDAAKARGFRPRDAMNPAAWRGHLALLLPAPSKLTRGHHAALEYAKLPAFMAELRERQAGAALCLEFAILTAARSGEALGARWSEIDEGAKVWTIPADRMKAAREHRVPLTDRALAILAEMKLARVSDFVFPGRQRGKPLSVMALEMVLRRMGVVVTVHGFRSTFRDWAGNETHFPRELAEHALAHVMGDKAEQAYRRGDALEKRRALMTAWAAYCVPTPAENVVAIRRKA